MKRKYHLGGEYFCHKCGHAHHDLSGVGQEHIKYANKAIQRENFLKYGVY